MRKRMQIIFLAMLLSVVSTVQVSAMGGDYTIQLCNQYAESITGNLSIATNGEANVRAQVLSSSDDTERIYLYVYLQRYVNEEWVNYKSWLQTSQTQTCTLNKSVEVLHGYSYRIEISAYIYTSNDSEHIVLHTGSKWY